MSVKIMGAVWDADLPHDEKFVLLSYADHAAHDGTSIYPSVGLTAWKTGYSERSIQIITKKLVEQGILVPEGHTVHGTNRYSINAAALPTRLPYRAQGGEESAPLGVKNLHQGGEESAPNPSCNHHDNHQKSEANASLPLAEAQPLPLILEMQEATPEPESTPVETLNPDTPEARQVFAKLAANAQAMGHRGPRRFPSLECKRSFLEAVATLGHVACLEAVDKALGQGITALPRLVAYVAAVADKKTRPTVIHLGSNPGAGAYA